jgi:hypothetical protein
VGGVAKSGFKAFGRLFFSLSKAKNTSFVKLSFSSSEYFEDCPSLDAIHANFSGVLINTNDAWDYPKAYPKNFVRVLGMHTDKEVKPLPKVRSAHACL